MSEEQKARLVEYFKRVVITLDGDEAGRNAAGEIAAARLVRRLHTGIVNVPDGRQPDQLSTDELLEVLGGEFM